MLTFFFSIGLNCVLTDVIHQFSFDTAYSSKQQRSWHLVYHDHLESGSNIIRGDVLTETLVPCI